MLDQSTAYAPVASLLEEIHAGRIALPAFQREYTWGADDARALLATVLMGWPAGGLLLLDSEGAKGWGQEDLDVRGFDGGPPDVSGFKYLVLDGQQRLTALYHALYDRGDYVYALGTEALRAKGIEEFEDAVHSFTRKAWSRRNNSKRYRGGSLVPFFALRSHQDFFKWQDEAHPERLFELQDERLAVDELYSTFLHRLHDYRFAVTEISAPAKQADVARIFERVNRAGMPLNAFDLAVARTHANDWDLRTEWERARLAYPRIDRFLSDDGMPVLQTIALDRLANVRQQAVLTMDGDYIRADWIGTLKAIDEALRFLAEDCGVRRPEWLPYDAMIVVLASVARRGALVGARANIAKQWFWSRALSQRFDVAVNTRVIEERRELGEALEASQLSTRPIVSAEQLLRATRQGQRALSRTFLCALGKLDETVGREPVVLELFARPKPGVGTLILNQVLASREQAKVIDVERTGPLLFSELNDFDAHWWPGQRQLLPASPESWTNASDLFRARAALFLDFASAQLHGVTPYEAPGEDEGLPARSAESDRAALLDRLTAEYQLLHGPDSQPTLGWLRNRAAQRGLPELF